MGSVDPDPGSPKLSLKKRKKLRFFMLEELSVEPEASPGASGFVWGKKTNMTDQKKSLVSFSVVLS